MEELRRCDRCSLYFKEKTTIFSEVQTKNGKEYWCPECCKQHSWCCDKCDYDFSESIASHTVLDGHHICNDCYKGKITPRWR